MSLSSRRRQIVMTPVGRNWVSETLSANFAEILDFDAQSASLSILQLELVETIAVAAAAHERWPQIDLESTDERTADDVYWCVNAALFWMGYVPADATTRERVREFVNRQYEDEDLRRASKPPA